VSLASLVLTLLGDIDDPAVRNDISSTLYFLRDLYIDGRIDEKRLFAEVKDIVKTVLSVTNPELLPDELEKKSTDFANQIVSAVKMETLRARLLSKFKPRTEELF